MATAGRSRPFRFALLVPTFVALGVSVLLHSAIPVAALAIPIQKARSRAQIELIRMPPSVNPVDPESPVDDEKDDDKDTPKPEKKAEKTPAKKPEKKTPKAAEKAKNIAKKANDAKEDGATPPKVLSDPRSKNGQIVKATAAELAKAYRDRIRAEREAKRALKQAEYEEAKAERQAQIDADRKKNGVGGIPPGDPRALFACIASERGKQIHLRAERAVEDWVNILPTVLMPFETRPSLGDYVGQTTQVVKRDRDSINRVGAVEMALPQEVLQLPLESPPGARLAVGHLDGRCLVGFSYTRGSPDLFPITLSRVPVRMLSAGKSSVALVDFTMDRDASFTLALHDKVDGADAGTILFRRGRLKNAKGIANTIANHINAAKTLSEVAGWFGIDVKKMSQEERKERLKESVKQVSNVPAPKPKAKTPGKTTPRTSSGRRGRR